MNKKDILILIIKVIIYACTLILGVLGVSSLTSCSASRNFDVNGRAVIVTNDTTIVNHTGTLHFNSKR